MRLIWETYNSGIARRKEQINIEQVFSFTVILHFAIKYL